MTESTEQPSSYPERQTVSILIRGGKNFWRLRLTRDGDMIELPTDYEAAATVLFHLMGDPRHPDVPPVGIEPFWRACQERRATIRSTWFTRLMAQPYEDGSFPAYSHDAWTVFDLHIAGDKWELVERSPASDFKSPVDYFAALDRLERLLREAVPFSLPHKHKENDYELAELVLKWAARNNPDLPARPRLSHERSYEQAQPSEQPSASVKGNPIRLRTGSLRAVLHRALGNKTMSIGGDITWQAEQSIG